MAASQQPDAAPPATSPRPSQEASASIVPPAEDRSGYYALADMMSLAHGLGQFKRFAKLNLHSLLMQQAEILHLEGRLDTYASVDEELGLNHSQSVEALLQSEETGWDDEQWRLILEIREKLKEYNQALLRQVEVWNLTTPRRHDSSVLRDWLARSQGGNNFLQGYEALPYFEEHSEDLVAISTRSLDSMTAWIGERLLPWASNAGIVNKPIVTGHDKDGVVKWPDSLLYRTAQTLAIVTSALIPSLSILILYFVPNMLGRIFVAMVLSFLFAASLSFATIARPAEIFAATAAFAAVQVVFIGSSSIANS